MLTKLIAKAVLWADSQYTEVRRLVARGQMKAWHDSGHGGYGGEVVAGCKWCYPEQEKNNP